MMVTCIGTSMQDLLPAAMFGMVAVVYYNHLGFINGTFTWGTGSGNKVGTGWAGVTAVGLGSINPPLISLKFKAAATTNVFKSRQ
jgi:hypothetical protein